MKFLVVVILPLFLFLIEAHADNGPRDTLAQMLQFYAQDAASTSASGYSATENSVENRIRSYRLSPIPGTSSIADAPFVGYIVQNEVLPTYSSLEQSQYPTAYAANVTNATLENLFDTFMGQVESGGLTGEIAKAGNEIGSCLAKKVEEGKAASCSLDVTDSAATDKPAAFTQLMMKISCPLPFSFYSPCDVRKAIYAMAKSELVTMRPQWPGLFNDAYPSSFRSTLLGGINNDRANIGKIVTSKFGGTYQDSFWSKAPLVDLDDTAGRTMTLHEFASGMSNDLRAASILSQSSDTATKGLGSALFYAGANRLLVLMGGVEAKWDGKAFEPAPGDVFDPKNPLSAPRYQTQVFGGLTAELSPSGETMLPLEITSYSPGPGHGVQLFASQFTMGEGAVPTLNGEPVETLQDLGELMNSLIDFMTLSEPGAALSSHFAEASSITDIVDPTKPALFPSEGRQLAAGLIAAIFQNILVDQGHLQQPPASGVSQGAVDPDHDGVFGLKFYDQVGVHGRLPGKVSIESLSTLFTAAIRFNNLINRKDPAIPAALVALQSEVDLAINLGLLSIISNGQSSDGGFVTNLGEASLPNPTGRTLAVCVHALRALTAGYAASPSGAVRQAIHAGWTYMDRFWAVTSANGFPLATEPQAGASPPSQAAAEAQTLWAVMNLWAESKNSAIYADLMNPSLDPDWQSTQGWDKWASRFGALQKAL